MRLPVESGAVAVAEEVSEKQLEKEALEPLGLEWARFESAAAATEAL